MQVRCLVIAICLAQRVATGSPILLATFDTYDSGGGAPESDPRIEFVLQLPTAFPPTDFFGLGQDRNIFWNDRELGTAYFNATNDPAFDLFALHATDGIDDRFMLWTRFPSGGGNGRLGVESELFGLSPDLVGNRLDYVKLTVFDVRFEPWVPDPETFPDIQGYEYLGFVRYEFYGTPVPEPEAFAILAIGVLTCSGLQHRIRRPAS